MDAQALGRYLRESREAKEITLEEAEQVLKIRRRILESFELGQFTFTDATNVQTRGFVRNYARFLGLDDDRVVNYYESALEEATNPRRKRSTRRAKEGEQAAKVPKAPRKITDTNPSLPAVVPTMLDRPARRSNLLNSLAMLLVAGASLAVIGFVVFQLIGQARPAQDTIDDNILDQLPPSPTFTLIPSQTVPPQPTQVINLQPAYTGTGVVVTIKLTQRTWLQVTADEQSQFTGLARPGDQLPDFIARDSVTVTASNAAALDVVYNGNQQSLFGGRGQQVDIIFTLTNVEVSSGPGFEPTSEFTATAPPTSAIDVGATVAALTPTITPGPSPTPTDTPTITPTFTETPTPLPSPTITYTPSITFTPSNTPTLTLTPTITQTPSPTAILPPRVTQEGLPATKPAP
ncbi:MAG: DUF4115 domain-containing protein [Anaerolineae bacterium]|nr:DUF4115 domain-containing protein [Anaerolineae bacterium]